MSVHVLTHLQEVDDEEKRLYTSGRIMDQDQAKTTATQSKLSFKPLLASSQGKV